MPDEVNIQRWHRGRDKGPVIKLHMILISSPRDAKPWRGVLTPLSTAWIHE